MSKHPSQIFSGSSICLLARLKIGLIFFFVMDIHGTFITFVYICIFRELHHPAGTPRDCFLFYLSGYGYAVLFFCMYEWMYMYFYIHVDTNMAHIHIYIYIYLYMYIYMYIYLYIFTYIYMQQCVYVHMSIHVHINTHIYTCMWVCVWARMIESATVRVETPTSCWVLLEKNRTFNRE